MRYPAFDASAHKSRIGLDEGHFVAIGPEEQIEVPGLTRTVIHRGAGAGAVRVHRIGTGIGDVLRDGAVDAERVDAANVPSPFTRSRPEKTNGTCWPSTI